MKNLKLYIKESLLDDEDILMTRDESNALTSEIQKIIGGSFEVTDDRKYIIYNIMSNSIEFEDYAISLDKLKKIDKYNLKFQPIRNIDIDDRNINDILKYLHSEGCGWLSISQTYNDNPLDLNNLKFPVKSLECNVRSWNITPPKEHINFVYLKRYHTDDRSDDWKNVKGWNCDSLMILTTPFEVWDNNVYTVGDFDKEKLQILIDNNPNVKEFLLTDKLYRELFKINFKGSKRIVDKIVKKSLKYTNKYVDLVNKYDKEIVKKFEKNYGKENKPIRLYK